MAADSTVDVAISADQLPLFAFDDIQHGLTQLLKSAEREVLQTSRAKAEWYVVSDHQFRVAVSPNGVSAEQLDSIAQQAWTTLAAAKTQLAETGDVDLPGLQGMQREALRAIVRHIGVDVEAVDVQINDLELLELVNPQREPLAQRTLYEEHGALTGVIDLLSLRGARRFFAFRDVDSGRIVRAYYTPEQLELVFAALEKLAEVSGLIRYRPDGLPVSITRIYDIFVYPPAPDDVHAEIDQLMGSVPDLLGGMSVDEHMDQVRGRELG